MALNPRVANVFNIVPKPMLVSRTTPGCSNAPDLKTADNDATGNQSELQPGLQGQLIGAKLDAERLQQRRRIRPQKVSNSGYARIDLCAELAFENALDWCGMREPASW